jgi:tetratricopeptide (TPR) repeat protein
MIRSVGYFSTAFLAALITVPAFCQAPPTAPTPPVGTAERASAYYNYTMGHMYSELAGAYGNRSDYLNKAIDYYRVALKQDPTATFLAEELADLYIQSGQLNRAVSEAEDLLKAHPDNLDARRILGRVYTRLIGDPQAGKVDQKMLKLAIEQYQKITEKEPNEPENWQVLGRLYRVDGNSVEAEKAYKTARKLDPDNDEAMLGLAMVYSDLGDAKSAIAMLKQASEKAPSARTLAMLASYYEQSRDYKSAADAWKQALPFAPDNDRIKRALAQDLLFSDRMEEARVIFEELAAANPGEAQLRLHLAEIYRQKRDFAKARKALDDAKKIDAAGVELRFEEVNLLEAEGKTDDAIKSLKTLLNDTAKKEYNDSEKSARNMLLEKEGLLYRETNNPALAAAAFRQIAEVDPELSPRVAAQIVETYRGAKDYETARKELDGAMRKYPKDRTLALESASLLADTGKTDDAVAVLRKQMNGQRDRETLLSIAQTYERAKRFEDELKALSEAEKLGKSPADLQGVQFMRGAMLEKMKEFDRAEAEFKRVLANDPENASALNYLGYMLAERNVRLDEAFKLISRALELDPGNGAYLDSLGWVYFRQNQFDKAEQNLRTALEKIGNDPTVHDHLGDVLLKEGRVKDAISQWEASLKEMDKTGAGEVDDTELASIHKKLETAGVRVANKGQATVKP